MFPVDVINIIVEYAFEDELLDWIDEKNLEWYWLSRNSKAINLLEKNLDKVFWTSLSQNPYAVHLLEENLDKIEPEYLSLNLNAIHILEKNLDKVDWEYLSQNSNAIDILEQRIEDIDWKKRIFIKLIGGSYLEIQTRFLYLKKI